MSNIDYLPQTSTSEDSKRISLDWFINPITKEYFFEKYYEQKTLHISREVKNYYSNLLTFETIENLLYSQALKFPTLRLTKLKEDISSEKYVLGDRVIPTQILKYFAEGSTIILSGLNEYIPSLGIFCSFMMKEFGHRFQTNIYITPAQSQGFDVHYDDHDVFILQIKGNKKWRLYGDNPVVLPHKLMPFEKGKYQHGPIAEEIMLNEGDLLYIPRGVMHDADTLDEMSIHITTGLIGYTWTDMIIEGILDLSKKNPELRKFVPSDLMNGKKGGEEFKEEFKNIFNQIKNSLLLDEMVNRLRKEMNRTQKNNIKGILASAIKIDKIDNQSMFSTRPEIIFSVIINSENLILEWVGKKIEFPIYTKHAIDFLINDPPDVFTVNDIPDCMEVEGKIALLKRLTKEGYLNIY